MSDPEILKPSKRQTRDIKDATKPSSAVKPAEDTCSNANDTAAHTLAGSSSSATETLWDPEILKHLAEILRRDAMLRAQAIMNVKTKPSSDIDPAKDKRTNAGTSAVHTAPETAPDLSMITVKIRRRISGQLQTKHIVQACTVKEIKKHAGDRTR